MASAAARTSSGVATCLACSRTGLCFCPPGTQHGVESILPARTAALMHADRVMYRGRTTPGPRSSHSRWYQAVMSSAVMSARRRSPSSATMRRMRYVCVWMVLGVRPSLSRDASHSSAHSSSVRVRRATARPSARSRSRAAAGDAQVPALMADSVLASQALASLRRTNVCPAVYLPPSGPV